MIKRLSNLLSLNKKSNSIIEYGVKNIFSNVKNYLKRGILIGAAVMAIGFAGCNIIPSPQNSPPKITSTPITQIYEGNTYDYPVQASDPDGDTLTYSLKTTPSAPWLSINSETGLIEGIAPQVDSDTNYNIEIDVSDGSQTAKQNYTLIDKNIGIIDLSSIDGSVNEGQKISITLPSVDTNGDPVTYTSAIKQSGDVTIDSSSLSSDQLSIRGSNNISIDEDYSVEIAFTNNVTGKTGTVTLTSKLYDLPDISGVLQDNETHTTQQGILEIIYTDANGTYSNIINNTTNPANPSTTDSEGNMVVYTDLNGNFNIRINERTDNLIGIILQAGLGNYTTTNPLTGFTGPYSGPSESWTRVLATSILLPYMAGYAQTLFLGDNSNLHVSIVPTGTTGLPLNSSPSIITTDEAFQKFVNDTEGLYLYKYGVNGNNLAVEIAGTSSYDGSTYDDSNALTEISSMATELSNIIPGGIIQYQTPGTPDPFHSGLGYEVIMPATRDYLNSIGGAGADGLTVLEGGEKTGEYGYNTSYVLNTLSSDISPTIQEVAIHELAHGLIAPLDLTSTEGYSQADSIHYGPNGLTSPTNADKKLTLIVYESTYKGLEEINKYILKNGFN